MKKIKITEQQKAMLDKNGAKLGKVDEMNIPPSQSPSRKVSKQFKSSTKGLGIKTEAVEGQVQWRELVPHVHQLIKQMYTNPSKEGMNPYWESVGVSWDEIIQMLSAVELIKSVKGGYRLAKIVQSPAKAVKIVAKLIEKMINDKNQPVEEISQDDIKKSLEKQLAPQSKSGKSKEEILKTIADKRKAELERRKAEKDKPLGEAGGSNYPAGAEYDSNAPWNQVDPEPKTKVNKRPYDLVWTDESEFAFFKKDGKLYVFYIDSVDSDEYAEYAAREEEYLGRDEDGDPMIEYGDWEMSAEVIDAYVNDNYEHLSFGVGLDDYENGTEMTEVTPELAKDLLGLAKYKVKRDPKSGETFVKILKSVGMQETTTAASSGAFVAPLATGPIHKSNVADELNEHDPEQAPYMDRLKELYNNGDVTPEQWLSYGDELQEIVKGLQPNKNYIGIISKVAQMLQTADMMQEFPEIAWKIAGTFVSAKHDLASEIQREASLPVEEATTTTSVGGDSGTFAYDAPVGDGSDFWHAGNKLNKKSTNENYRSGFVMNEKEQAYYNYQVEYNNTFNTRSTSFEEYKMKARRLQDAANKAGINYSDEALGLNEMVAREGKDAKTDTQWPGGKFVEFDDCTKFNNNKVAQKGGCSVGAVDGVVKTKGSKHSVISDASIYEEVAKATGRSIEEVKSIIDGKINKSS